MDILILFAILALMFGAWHMFKFILTNLAGILFATVVYGFIFISFMVFLTG
jgi:hypothetical protein